ncbi:MAG: hypothetical protein ACLVJH_06980 [Faecalibacterium prausnitzii]
MPQRGQQKPLHHLHDGGRRFADALYRPGNGQHQSVVPLFRRTTAWDDIGYTAIPRRLWGTYRAGDESAKGIRWMTFPAGAAAAA